MPRITSRQITTAILASTTAGGAVIGELLPPTGDLAFDAVKTALGGFVGFGVGIAADIFYLLRRTKIEEIEGMEGIIRI